MVCTREGRGKKKKRFLHCTSTPALFISRSGAPLPVSRHLIRLPGRGRPYRRSYLAGNNSHLEPQPAANRRTGRDGNGCPTPSATPIPWQEKKKKKNPIWTWPHEKTESVFTPPEDFFFFFSSLLSECVLAVGESTLPPCLNSTTQSSSSHFEEHRLEA